MQQESEASASAQKWAGQFIRMATCPECNGQRLNKEALHYKIAGKNIAELSAMDISELYEWLEGVEEQLNPKQRQIAVEILKEIRCRIGLSRVEPCFGDVIGGRESTHPFGDPDR